MGKNTGLYVILGLAVAAGGILTWKFLQTKKKTVKLPAEPKPAQFSGAKVDNEVHNIAAEQVNPVKREAAKTPSKVEAAFNDAIEQVIMRRVVYGSMPQDKKAFVVEAVEALNNDPEYHNIKVKIWNESAGDKCLLQKLIFDFANQSYV